MNFAEKCLLCLVIAAIVSTQAAAIPVSDKDDSSLKELKRHGKSISSSEINFPSTSHRDRHALIPDLLQNDETEHPTLASEPDNQDNPQHETRPVIRIVKRIKMHRVQSLQTPNQHETSDRMDDQFAEGSRNRFIRVPRPTLLKSLKKSSSHSRHGSNKFSIRRNSVDRTAASVSKNTASDSFITTDKHTHLSNSREVTGAETINVYVRHPNQNNANLADLTAPNSLLHKQISKFSQTDERNFVPESEPIIETSSEMESIPIDAILSGLINPTELQTFGGFGLKLSEEHTFHDQELLPPSLNGKSLNNVHTITHTNQRQKQMSTKLDNVEENTSPISIPSLHTYKLKVPHRIRLSEEDTFRSQELPPSPSKGKSLNPLHTITHMSQKQKQMSTTLANVGENTPPVTIPTLHKYKLMVPHILRSSKAINTESLPPISDVDITIQNLDAPYINDANHENKARIQIKSHSSPVVIKDTESIGHQDTSKLKVPHILRSSKAINTENTESKVTSLPLISDVDITIQNLDAPYINDANHENKARIQIKSHSSPVVIKDTESIEHQDTSKEESPDLSSNYTEGTSTETPLSTTKTFITSSHVNLHINEKTHTTTKPIVPTPLLFLREEKHIDDKNTPELLTSLNVSTLKLKDIDKISSNIKKLLSDVKTSMVMRDQNAVIKETTTSKTIQPSKINIFETIITTSGNDSQEQTTIEPSDNLKSMANDNISPIVIQLQENEKQTLVEEHRHPKLTVMLKNKNAKETSQSSGTDSSEQESELTDNKTNAGIIDIQMVDEILFNVSEALSELKELIAKDGNVLEEAVTTPPKQVLGGKALEIIINDSRNNFHEQPTKGQKHFAPLFIRNDDSSSDKISVKAVKPKQEKLFEDSQLAVQLTHDSTFNSPITETAIFVTVEPPIIDDYDITTDTAASDTTTEPIVTDAYTTSTNPNIYETTDPVFSVTTTELDITTDVPATTTNLPFEPVVNEDYETTTDAVFSVTTETTMISDTPEATDARFSVTTEPMIIEDYGTTNEVFTETDAPTTLPSTVTEIPSKDIIINYTVKSSQTKPVLEKEVFSSVSFSDNGSDEDTTSLTTDTLGGQLKTEIINQTTKVLEFATTTLSYDYNTEYKEQMTMEKEMRDMDMAVFFLKNVLSGVTLPDVLTENVTILNEEVETTTPVEFPVAIYFTTETPVQIETNFSSGEVTNAHLEEVTTSIPTATQANTKLHLLVEQRVQQQPMTELNVEGLRHHTPTVARRPQLFESILNAPKHLTPTKIDSIAEPIHLEVTAQKTIPTLTEANKKNYLLVEQRVEQQPITKFIVQGLRQHTPTIAKVPQLFESILNAPKHAKSTEIDSIAEEPTHLEITAQTSIPTVTEANRKLHVLVEQRVEPQPTTEFNVEGLQHHTPVIVKTPQLFESTILNTLKHLKFTEIDSLAEPNHLEITAQKSTVQVPELFELTTVDSSAEVTSPFEQITESAVKVQQLFEVTELVGEVPIHVEHTTIEPAVEVQKGVQPTKTDSSAEVEKRFEEILFGLENRGSKKSKMEVKLVPVAVNQKLTQDPRLMNPNTRVEVTVVSSRKSVSVSDSNSHSSELSRELEDREFTSAKLMSQPSMVEKINPSENVNIIDGLLNKMKVKSLKEDHATLLGKSISSDNSLVSENIHTTPNDDAVASDTSSSLENQNTNIVDRLLSDFKKDSKEEVTMNNSFVVSEDSLPLPVKSEIKSMATLSQEEQKGLVVRRFINNLKIIMRNLANQRQDPESKFERELSDVLPKVNEVLQNTVKGENIFPFISLKNDTESKINSTIPENKRIPISVLKKIKDALSVVAQDLVTPKPNPTPTPLDDVPQTHTSNDTELDTASSIQNTFLIDLVKEQLQSNSFSRPSTTKSEFKTTTSKSEETEADKPKIFRYLLQRQAPTKRKEMRELMVPRTMFVSEKNEAVTSERTPTTTATPLPMRSIKNMFRIRIGEQSTPEPTPAPHQTSSPVAESQPINNSKENTYGNIFHLRTTKDTEQTDDSGIPHLIRKGLTEQGTPAALQPQLRSSHSQYFYRIKYDSGETMEPFSNPFTISTLARTPVSPPFVTKPFDV